MKKWIAALSILAALQSSAQPKKRSSEERILDTVLSLPEVSAEAKKIEALSHGKRHLSDVIGQRPEKDLKYYWVKVGEDNGAAFVTYFHFYVDPKTFEISYYDELSDRLIDLETWRKQQAKINNKD